MVIRGTRGGWFGVGLVAVLSLILPARLAEAESTQPHAAFSAPSRARTLVAHQPLRFEAIAGNAGFLSRGNGYSMVLAPGSAAVSLQGPDRAAAVRMTWPGANRNVHPVGTDLAPGVTNYLIGSDSSQWRRGVQSFGKVRYPALYPGIDLVFYGNQQQLEYDFVVAPGGDPKNIRLRVSGGDALRIDAEGNLVIRAGSAEMVQRAPVVYQEHDGTRHLVAGRYVKTGRHEVGFAVGDYDRTRTLSIDPVLTYSSFLGGSGGDYAQAVAVDSAGSAYVTGYTASTNFPTTPGAYSTTCSTCATYYDVFVTKISATGVLMYSTYVGTGNTSEKGLGIAVDLAGNAYVAGTVSYPGSGVTFPVINGFTIDARTGGGFLFKLNSSGSSLLYSTLIQNASECTGVAVVGGTAYVTGSAYGSYPTFPIAAYANNTTYSTRIGPGAGGWEAFVVKIDTSAVGLASLVYATRFGGSDLNYGNAIAVNAAGEAYVTGETASTDFPTTAGAAQPSCAVGGPCHGTYREAFVSKLDAAGTALVYSTLAGGADHDRGNAIAIDSSGNAYVAGETFSLDFPTTVGALSRTHGSFGPDGFVFKLNSTGTSFDYSTFLGGAASDTAYAIAVDSGGYAYVAGDAGSADFPVVNAIQPFKASNNWDAFVSKLNFTGSALVYSSYLGGTGGVSGGDKAFGLALDPAGDVWVVGQTDSLDFPVKPNAISITHGGGQFDGFVVKLGDALSVTSVLPTSGSTAGGTAVTVTGTGFMSGVTVTFGGAAATAVYPVTPTTITLSVPAHALGVVDVVVTSADGRVATLSGGFTYVTRPALTFTDDPLQAGVTRVKAIHMTELRTSVNTLRSRYALTSFSFTDPTLTANVTRVRAVHLTELRTALAQVYTAASRTVPTWNPGTVTVGSTIITAAQLTELRTATSALW